MHNEDHKMCLTINIRKIKVMIGCTRRDNLYKKVNGLETKNTQTTTIHAQNKRIYKDKCIFWHTLKKVKKSAAFREMFALEESVLYRIY